MKGRSRGKGAQQTVRRGPPRILGTAGREPHGVTGTTGATTPRDSPAMVRAGPRKLGPAQPRETHSRWCGRGSWGDPGRGRVRICCKGAPGRDRHREKARNIEPFSPEPMAQGPGSARWCGKDGCGVGVVRTGAAHLALPRTFPRHHADPGQPRGLPGEKGSLTILLARSSAIEAFATDLDNRRRQGPSPGTAAAWTAAVRALEYAAIVADKSPQAIRMLKLAFKAGRRRPGGPAGLRGRGHASGPHDRRGRRGAQRLPPAPRPRLVAVPLLLLSAAGSVRRGAAALRTRAGPAGHGEPPGVSGRLPGKLGC